MDVHLCYIYIIIVGVSFIRLSELRDVLVDVRAKQESELNERRTLEQQMSKK